LHRDEILRIVEAHKGLGLLGVVKIALAIGEITQKRVDVRTPGDLAESFRAKVAAEARPV
jgi:predicted nucleotidyltransferase